MYTTNKMLKPNATAKKTQSGGPEKMAFVVQFLGSDFEAHLCCRHTTRPNFWWSESDPRTGTKKHIKNALAAAQKIITTYSLLGKASNSNCFAKKRPVPLKEESGCQPLAGAGPRPAKTLLPNLAGRAACHDLRIQPGDGVRTLHWQARRALAREQPSRQRLPCGPEEPYLPRAACTWSTSCDLHGG
jgi:hypothetical protein